MNQLLLLALLCVGCFVAGVELGGRWAAWLAWTAVRRAGVEWEFAQAIEQLMDPNNWRENR